MEDAMFTRDHNSNSPLPEAGHDPGDPLRPEIDEENSTPNPPITDPHQDMEVTEEQAGMPDQDDLEEAGLSDNESVLSELDDGQFEDFDAADLAIEERPAQMIDDTNVNLIGVHKRKRTEADGEPPKKKKKKADKPRRKKRGDDEVSANEDSGARKSRRSRKEGGGKARERAASEDADANLTPEERTYRYIQCSMCRCTDNKA
jgi:transcription factor SPN1